MRVLVMSDIHANLPALQAVLANAQGAYDAVWCLGDVVGYGPNPNECTDTVRALPNLTCLRGNHDLAALGAAKSTTSTLTPRRPRSGPALNFQPARESFFRG